MALKIQELLKSSPKGFAKPVYVLHGDEDFFIDRVLKLMETAIIPESEAAFNRIIVYGKDSSLDAIASAARQFPFIGSRMLIMVKDAQLLAGIGLNDQVEESDGAPKPSDAAKKMEALLGSMPPSTCLVFAFRGKKLDARKAMCRLFDKKEILWESEKMKDNQLPEHIKTNLNDLGYKIDIKAAQVMADVVGNDLSRMENEIQKLIVRYGKDKPIIADDIYTTIGISKEYNIFEFQSAFCHKNLGKMLAILAVFQSNLKEHPMVKEGLVFASYLIKILNYKHLLLEMSTQEANKTLKLNYFQEKDFPLAARNYATPQIDRILELFLNADRQVKGLSASVMDEEEVYKELQIGLLSLLSNQE